MNILFVTLGHMSKHRGGVDRVTDTLYHELTRRGHCLKMLSYWRPHPDDKMMPCQYLFPDEKYYNADANSEFLAAFLKEHKIDVIINQADAIDVVRLVARSRGDAKYIQAFHGDPLAVVKELHLLDAPIATARDWGRLPIAVARYAYRKYNRKKFLKEKYRLIYDSCDAFVLLSKHYIPKVLKMIGRYDEQGKLRAINNPDTYEQDEIDGKRFEKEKLALYVGRLTYANKRVDRLIDIWSRAKTDGWKLLIIGEGPDRPLFEKMVSDRGFDNVQFIGQTDPRPYYQKAQVLCMTSTSEGYPLVLREAQQYGVAPICFLCSEAMRDIITDGYDGFLIKENDRDEYVNRLNSLLTEPSLLERIRENIIAENGKRLKSVSSIGGQWDALVNEMVTSMQQSN